MKEKDLLQKLQNDDHKILIYGAGMVGSLVFHRLLAGGILKERIAFIVSHKEQKNDTFLGQNIFDIHDNKVFFENAHIIVSTLPGTHQSMINTLHENNYYDFDIVDNSLFEEMEKLYVAKHNQEYPVTNTTKDILFMASDNNCSSGAFLCMVDLNCELNKRGIPTLVVLPSYGSGEELLRSNHIDYTYILSEDWLIKNGDFREKDFEHNNGAIRSIQELIKKCRIKLLHNNTTYTYIGAVAAKKENIPIVWHLREYIKEQGYWFYDEEKAFQLINCSDAVIVVSDYIRISYKKLQSSIVHKIYDGVDAETFYCKNHSLMTEEKIKILMPGMITTLKGQKQLLEAALLLKQQERDQFEIVFVGNEEAKYGNELKMYIAENGLEDIVIFYSRSREIAKWYLWADIVVVCSGAEAFGRVAVEALLSGCLVIGADKGATVEIIEDKRTGYLYQYGNTQDLALKIKKAIHDKKSTQKMAELGREKVKRLFTKEHNADEVIKVYEQILKGRSNERKYTL